MTKSKVLTMRERALLYRKPGPPEPDAGSCAVEPPVKPKPPVPEMAEP